MAIRTLIVDDHPVVRLGLRAMFAEGEVEIVGEAASQAEAISAIEQQQPQVVLMDVRLGPDDGLNVLRAARERWPTLAVLMFSNYNNPTYVARAMAYGALGFVPKECSRDDLLAALRAAARGEAVWAPAEVRRYTGALRSGKLADGRDVTLTHRESEVLHQMAYGLTNKEIAEALGISYETVKEHVQHILKKLGVTDRTQAAVWAVRSNLV